MRKEVAEDMAVFAKSTGRVGGWIGTRLVEWFLAQPEPMQSVVLREVDTGIEPAYIDGLRRMADDLEARLGQSGTNVTRAARFGDSQSSDPTVGSVIEADD